MLFNLFHEIFQRFRPHPYLENCKTFTMKFLLQRYLAAKSPQLFFRSGPPKLFLGKGFLKICSKLTREHHPCQIAISIKLLCNFTEIALRHACSLVNSLHILRTPFLKNTSKVTLLKSHFGLGFLLQICCIF